MVHVKVWVSHFLFGLDSECLHHFQGILLLFLNTSENSNNICTCVFFFQSCFSWSVWVLLEIHRSLFTGSHAAQPQGNTHIRSVYKHTLTNINEFCVTTVRISGLCLLGSCPVTSVIATDLFISRSHLNFLCCSEVFAEQLLIKDEHVFSRWYLGHWTSPRQCWHFSVELKQQQCAAAALLVGCSGPQSRGGCYHFVTTCIPSGHIEGTPTQLA